MFFATQAADSTGSQIRLIIIGLLVVAALLAGLTIWYWRYTDPKRRPRDPLAESSIDASATATVPAVQSSEPTDEELLGDDGADEWLRLTGPDALRRQ